MGRLLKSVFENRKKDKKTAKNPAQTSPLSEDQIQISSVEKDSLRPCQFLIASGQSDGRQRDHNEDTLFTLSATIADGKHDLSLGVCIVADGMGGHVNGAIASGVATRVVGSSLVSKIYSHFLDVDQKPFAEGLQEIMESAISEAHKSVLRSAPGGGTTLTSVLILGEQMTVGHIGDSRAYLFHTSGSVQKITRDHSLVQRMVELEEITAQEASVHPQRNVLLKALGQTESVIPDIQTLPVHKGDSLLVCSDGLWGVVADEEMLKIAQGEADAVSACQKLIHLANDRGGPDNISVILVRFVG